MLSGVLYGRIQSFLPHPPVISMTPSRLRGKDFILCMQIVSIYHIIA